MNKTNSFRAKTQKRRGFVTCTILRLCKALSQIQATVHTLYRCERQCLLSMTNLKFCRFQYWDNAANVTRKIISLLPHVLVGLIAPHCKGMTNNRNRQESCIAF